ncbi:hypothetical protein SM757_31805, partial [Azohydromonas lata]|nr:hypothetical protein [Azohydromonas lata]
MGSQVSNAFLLSDFMVPAPADAAVPPLELEPQASVESLARVHEELSRLLEAVPRTLQRLRRGAAPAEGDAAAVQQLAVRQLRQAAGALRIAGFEQTARLPQAAAALLEPPATRGELAAENLVEAVEQGCAALQAYLRRWRLGSPLSPLALFPAWSRLCTLAGAERVHPADLWPVPWRWLALPADERLPPLQPAGPARTAAEQLTLALMRDARSPAAARLSDLFAALARGAADGRMATLWGLAAAVYEGQAKGLLVPDVHLKRVSARLLAQIRRGPLGTVDEATQRLAHDLLFFCAQAGTQVQASSAPRLAAVRHAWELQRHPAVDIDHVLPAAPDAALLAHTLRQVATAQALWDGAAAGTPHPGLSNVFAQLAQAIRQLLPKEELAAQALGTALEQAAAVGTPWTALALEVAQALLALQMLLQESDTEPPGAQLQRLATRVAQVLAADPLDVSLEHLPVEPWLLALSQRGAERQALAALGQSLRTAINEAGLQIDALAQTADENTLRALRQRLHRLEGVLAQLGRTALAQGMRQLREALPAQARVLEPAAAAGLAQ